MRSSISAAINRREIIHSETNPKLITAKSAGRVDCACSSIVRVESLMAAGVVALRISSSKGLTAAAGTAANSSFALKAESFATRVANPPRKSPSGLRNARAIITAATGQASALTRTTQGEAEDGWIG